MEVVFGRKRVVFATIFYKIDANSSQWIVDIGAKLRGKTFIDRNPKKTP